MGKLTIRSLFIVSSLKVCTGIRTGILKASKNILTNIYIKKSLGHTYSGFNYLEQTEMHTDFCNHKRGLT